MFMVVTSVLFSIGFWFRFRVKDAHIEACLDSIILRWFTARVSAHEIVIRKSDHTLNVTKHVDILNSHSSWFQWSRPGPVLAMVHCAVEAISPNKSPTHQITQEIIPGTSRAYKHILSPRVLRFLSSIYHSSLVFFYTLLLSCFCTLHLFSYHCPEMVDLYLLVRKLSCYTEADIFLGAFTSVELAWSAKAQYIRRIRTNGDPHEKQGYMTVNLDHDIRVRKPQRVEVGKIVASKDDQSKDIKRGTIQSENCGDWKIQSCHCRCRNKGTCDHKCCAATRRAKEDLHPEVRLLTHFVEGFGQRILERVHLIGSFDQIRVIANAHKTIMGSKGGSEWPSYWQIDILRINELRFENTPSVAYDTDDLISSHFPIPTRFLAE